MFGGLGRLVVKHPWWTILIWIVAAVAVAASAPKLHTKTDQTDFLPTKYESVQASKLQDKAFPNKNQKTSPEMIVVKRTDGHPLTAADSAKIEQIAKGLPAQNIVNVSAAASTPEMIAKNRSMQLIAVPLPSSFGDQKLENQNKDAVKKIRDYAKTQLQGSGLEYGVTGDAASNVDNDKSAQTMLAVISLGAIILILVLVSIIFRSLIAALLPIVTVGLVIFVQSKVTAIVANAVGLNVDSQFDVVIDVVLFGIGTDYILFLLFRFRERLRMGEDKRTAMIETVSRVGEAIASAAGAVIVAFLVLLLANFKSFGALGPELAIAVACMFVTAMTLVPAVVSLIGPATFWPSKSWKREPKPGLWAKFGRGVGARPAMSAGVAGLVMVVLALGALGFKADYDFNAGSPQNTESAKAMKDLRANFPAGSLTPVDVFVKGDNPLTRSELSSFSAKLKQTPGVAQVQAPVVSTADPTVAKIDLILSGNPSSNASISLVKGPLRDYVHSNTPAGMKSLVGGQTAAFADINEVNDRDLSVILPVAVVLIAIILALLLRSLVAPIYLVVAVLLGFASTVGATVFLFQGAEGKNGLVFQLPILLYLFVMAIGTDYNILVIARLREEAREGRAPREAARQAVTHAGPTVAAAGVLLAGTFALMTISPIAFMAELGFGVAIGITLSAFVMSAFLVPGITAMLGHRAWWPGHGDAGKHQDGQDPYDDRRPRAMAGH
jgi:RND superfamily putative drug exporter